MAGPLHGIKVIDLSTVVAGPFATQILGDMGAEVLKVEPPQGDIVRAPGPARSPGMGAIFLNCNRNKTSIVLDLKNTADRDRLLELIDGADVLIHNMRLAAADRAGLGQEDLLKRNPRLIYCAIVGYGQDGPYRDRPAYDDIIQAASGWAGMAQQAGGEPRYAPTIVADKTTSLYAVSAITAALYHRSQTQQGQYVEIPMYEVMASFLLVEHLGGLTFQPPLGPSGYSRGLSPHRRPYQTKDGYLAVMPYTAAHWRRFFSAAGREDWATDERLGNNATRASNIDLFYERLATCIAERDNATWLKILLEIDIPCAPVNSVDDLLEDEHLRAVGFFQPTQHPTEGNILTIRPPMRFSKTPCQVDTLAPRLGKAPGKP